MENDDLFSNDFDPYMELLQNSSNIQQLAAAFNQQAALVQQLAKQNQHLQEVIQQLQFNDRKQRTTIDRHSQELILIHNEVQSLKNSP